MKNPSYLTIIYHFRLFSYIHPGLRLYILSCDLHYQWTLKVTAKVIEDNSVGIKPPKARRDVTKLDLTIPLLSFWYINIDLCIQPISLTLYMTWVH